MIKQANISFTLILGAILSFAISFLLPKNGEKYLADMFWVTKTFAPQNYNVVLMGDSRVYRGLSPEIMDTELNGLKILNFGYSNGGLNPVMFEAAEEKLSKNGREKIIVIGVTANTLTNYTKENNKYFQELNRPREEILERLYLNPVSYYFSATSPETLKDHIQNWNKRKKSWYINNYQLNGYVESDKFPVDTLEAIPSYTKDFTNYQVDAKHMQDLFQQIEQWTQRGIQVFAFRPPISQAMRELENNMGLYDEKRIKKGIENSGGHWIDLQNSDYKTYDGSHVDLNSARKLSLKIAKEVKSFIGN